MICRKEDIKEYLETSREDKGWSFSWYDLYENAVMWAIEKDQILLILKKNSDEILKLIEEYIKEYDYMLSIGEDFGQSDNDYELSMNFMGDLVEILTRGFTEVIESDIDEYRISEFELGDEE